MTALDALRFFDIQCDISNLNALYRAEPIMSRSFKDMDGALPKIAKRNEQVSSGWPGGTQISPHDVEIK